MRLSDWEQRLLDQKYSEHMDREDARRRRNLPCRDDNPKTPVDHWGECLRCNAACGERCLEKSEPSNGQS